MEKPDSTKYQYSRDTLCDLSNSAAAKVRPECLSSDFNGLDGIWDPERWHMYLSGKRSRGPSPNQLIENGKRPIDSDREFYRSRRPSDAKERIKEERDGIILSPQRRSFGHGCQVSAQIFQRRGSGSPLENKDSGDGHGSSNLGSQRRIGSGRLASRTRSVEYENKDRQGRDYEHEKETRFERYSSNRRITRSEGRRMRQEEEPEWYSAGPSSQSETIELRGFHKEDLKDVRDSSYKQNRVKSHDGSFETHTSSSPETSQEHDTSGPVPEEKTFDINQFFSLTDTFPGLNDAVTPDIADISQTSRFSQWFSTSGVRSHNSSCSGSRRSTPNEELVFLHELSGRRSPLIPSPTPEGSLFLPITPPNDKVKQQAFLEMLQRANINIPKTTVQLNEQNLSGKVKSVAELEAELNGMVIGNNNRNKRPDHHAHHCHHHNTVMNTDIQQPQTFTDKPQTVNLGGDMSAFDKLVFNMKVSGSLPEAAKPVGIPFFANSGRNTFMSYLPNTPPSVNTGLFSQSVNAPIMSQRSQSPVNLTKWFGTDVLRQPLPQMPPMIHHGKNVLSVEDIECHQ
ncbi:eukaryotic translation initiation factor 4E transporter-like [Saccoglossus kowalevskii]